MSQNMFIYSSTDRHLGCFLILATVRKEIKNLNVRAKIVKLLEENRKNLLDVVLAVTFWIWYQKQRQNAKKATSMTTSN